MPIQKSSTSSRMIKNFKAGFVTNAVKIFPLRSFEEVKSSYQIPVIPQLLDVHGLHEKFYVYIFKIYVFNFMSEFQTEKPKVSTQNNIKFIFPMYELLTSLLLCGMVILIYLVPISLF